MKNIFNILVFVVIVIGCFAVYQYVEAQKSIWQQQAQYELQQKIREDERNQAAKYARAKWWANHTDEVYTVVALLVVSSVVFAGWHVYDKRREAHNRAVDGMFPLQQMKVADSWLLVNPNNAPLPILNVAQPQLPMNQGDYILQSEMNKGASKVALAQAKASRAMPIRYAAEAKMEAGYWDREPQGQSRFKVVEAETPLLEEQPIKHYEFDEAIAQSSKLNWVVGQESSTEELMRFDFTKQSHALVCGGTNCGKTSSTGYLLALMALKSKMHVCIFDGADGADWLPFERYTEFKLVEPEDLKHIVARIEQLYEERQEDLKRAGVANNYDLKPPLQPIIIILDEVGFMLAGLEKKAKEEVTKRLTRAIRVIRKVGIHLVLIDQNVQNLPSQLLTNINCIFAYKAEGMASNAIKRYNLDKLKPQGQYDYNGKVVDVWHTAKFLDAHLNGLKPVRGKYFNLDSVKSVTSNNDKGVSSDEIDGEYTLEKTSYSTSYQSDNGSSSGSKVVTSGYGVTTLQDRVTTAITSKKPLLQGEPVTSEDKRLVYDVAQLVSKNKAYEALWGGKNGKRQGWLNSIIEEYEGANATA